ncbi:MAG: hypothetical protein ABR924_11300, partial [Terracidiphilus sp.]
MTPSAAADPGPGPRRRVFVCGVEENQPLRRDRGDGGQKFFAPLTVGLRVALGGVKRFLRP